ncbi:MAG: MoaD/ThiS family protein [Bacteroidetes bacterium]|nr:MoaD/ThiS family protein [Bacteroidota bacterium]
MRITFKTASGMVKYLPAGSRGGSAEITVADGATPSDVMTQLGIPPEGTYLVTRNGSAVTIAMRASLSLADNDTLAIMPPLRGG